MIISMQFPVVRSEQSVTLHFYSNVSNWYLSATTSNSLALLTKFGLFSVNETITFRYSFLSQGHISCIGFPKAELLLYCGNLKVPFSTTWVILVSVLWHSFFEIIKNTPHLVIRSIDNKLLRREKLSHFLWSLTKFANWPNKGKFITLHDISPGNSPHQIARPSISTSM